jgi:hypothetical protein
VSRPHWDFEYLPISSGYTPAPSDVDFVVATSSGRDPEEIARAIGTEAEVEELLIRPPLFWYRVRVGALQQTESIVSALTAAGIRTRYVTCAVMGSLARGPRPAFEMAAVAKPSSWAVRPARRHVEPEWEGRWFLGSDAGVDVDRSVCGTGAGTRLAVIDDEARGAHILGLDAEVLVGVSAASRDNQHGSLMVGWAVGTRGDPERGLSPFTGVAPDASPRLYLMAKPGRDVVGLPLAIVRAVEDGADVVVCASYVEGQTSPLLDDALDFAARLGREGLGTLVVFPTGREISSPAGSLHASLTLGLGEPASDSRVLCVAPSGRHGGWFLWTDKRGKKKPFANRGPAVRLAAPGDDMASPLAEDGRLGHAESSGASAIAAGVALLVLERNPHLRMHELCHVLASTARPCEGAVSGPLSDPADVLPLECDLDRHDAKCGYGRISARRACLIAGDPVSAGLVAIGEEDAAAAYAALRNTNGSVALAYSRPLAACAARAFREDATFSHAVRSILRHLRLVGGRTDRRQSQDPAAFARALSIVLDQIPCPDAFAHVHEELLTLRGRAIVATGSQTAAVALESQCWRLASELWQAKASEASSSKT